MKATLLIVFLFFLVAPALSQASDPVEEALVKTRSTINEIAPDSFPEIKLRKIHVKSFESDQSFFKARYSVWRFATFQRMRHLVFVNARAFELKLPENAFRSIIAHELSHVSYYTRKNRLELLGLVRLTSSSAVTVFERKADLEAIEKGFGAGLIEYREWLYKNIPASDAASKMKTYFSPGEIRLIMRAVREKPAIVAKWRNKIPRNIETIRRDTGYE